MRRLEKTVQILYWLFVLIFFVSGISYDQIYLIPFVVTKVLLIIISIGILYCLIRYYFFNKKFKR